MMKTVRRWAASIVASFDSVISQVENHDALVQSAIREVQEAAARAKVQLGRVRHDGQLMRRRIIELREQEELWQSRAKESAEESKALECLKRRKRILTQMTALEEREREHATVERQLIADLGCVEERLRNLKEQRNLMRTRQSRAEALSAASGADSVALGEIDEIFERWETKVSEYEIRGSCDVRTSDALEEEFLTSEEESDLRAELASLRARPGTATGGEA